MAEHTPGPWSLPHFAEPDVNCECEYVLCDHLMGAVATVHCSGEGDDWQKHGDNPKFAEAVANARLIAAAPDMLAALRNVRKLISEAAMTGFNCHDGDWAERLFASQHVTSAAIAKATALTSAKPQVVEIK